MHGLIHVVFKSFITTNFGDETWQKVLKKAEISKESDILQMKQYDDVITFTAVRIACEILKVPRDDALELFGEFFVDYVKELGHYRQLSSFGNTFPEFLSSLNEFHHHLERDMRDSSFPIFECTAVDGEEDTHILTYISSRVGLHALLMGVLKRVVRTIFYADIKIEPIKVAHHEGWPRLAREDDDVTTILKFKIIGSPVTPDYGLSKRMQKVEPVSFWDFHKLMISCCASPPVLSKEDSSIVVRVKRADLQDDKCCHELFYEPIRSFVRAVNESSLDKINERLIIALGCFREMKAELVAAPWSSLDDLDMASDFWNAYELDAFTFFQKSLPICRQKGKNSVMPCIYFVSHAWSEPTEWKEIMGQVADYGEMKAAALWGVAKDLAAKSGDISDVGWRNISFWVDKSCLPQEDPELMRECLDHIEEFIQLSEGLVVVFTWQYFERLWCVYEWVCFLCFHDPMNVILCIDSFTRDRSIPLFIESIRNFKVKNSKCKVAADKQVLLDKLSEYYVSDEAFERFLKFSTIALICRTMASRHAIQGLKALKPWQMLARDCGFVDLAGAIGALGMSAVKWRAQYSADALSKGEYVVTHGMSNDMQTYIQGRVDNFFKNQISPMIYELRKTVLHSDGYFGLGVLQNITSRYKEFAPSIVRTYASPDYKIPVCSGSNPRESRDLSDFSYNANRESKRSLEHLLESQKIFEELIPQTLQ